MNLCIADNWFFPDRKRTGKEIDRIIKKSGLTIEGFTNELNSNGDANIDVKTVYSWRNGDSIPKLENLDLIKKKFDVSFEELLLPDQFLKKYYTKHLVSIDDSCLPFQKEFFGKFYCKGFDKNNYPIPVNEIVFSENFYDEKFNHFIEWEYLLQTSLFSYNEYNLDSLYGYTYHDLMEVTSLEKFLMYINNTYGRRCKEYLDNETRNEILFEFYTKHFNSKYVRSTFFKILLANNIMYQKGVVMLLPPLYREYVYNALIILGSNEFAEIEDLLKSKDCKKYLFLKKCNFSLEENYTNDFKDCELRMKQVGTFEKCIDFIENYMMEISYKDYLKERSE